MALTRREQAEYDRLRAKRGTAKPARRTREDDGDDDPDEGVYVLAGRHADGFLDRLFGPASSNGHAADDDDEEDDDDDEDDEEDQADDAPPPGNKFFRSRR